MALDPVCGREIHPKQSQWLLSFEGRAYHFCSGDCEHRFNDHPSDFARLAEESESKPVLTFVKAGVDRSVERLAEAPSPTRLRQPVATRKERTLVGARR